MVPLEGDNGDAGEYGEVSDIPALSVLVRDSLRHVSLEFRPEKTNCFGKKLVKFFAENGMALEEMCVDDGNGRMHEHMNRKVETWVAN